MIVNQYGLTRRFRVCEVKPADFKITYLIDTHSGQSGAPVISGEKIIAIHVGAGNNGENFNVGRLITLDMIKLLFQWCNELKGTRFQVS